MGRDSSVVPLREEEAKLATLAPWMKEGIGCFSVDSFVQPHMKVIRRRGRAIVLFISYCV